MLLDERPGKYDHVRPRTRFSVHHIPPGALLYLALSDLETYASSLVCTSLLASKRHALARWPEGPYVSSLVCTSLHALAPLVRTLHKFIAVK